MVGVKVEEVELLCSPKSVAFSIADNLLASDIAIVLLVSKAFGPSNYWVKTDPAVYPASHFCSPMIDRGELKLIRNRIDACPSVKMCQFQIGKSLAQDELNCPMACWELVFCQAYHRRFTALCVSYYVVYRCICLFQTCASAVGILKALYPCILNITLGW